MCGSDTNEDAVPFETTAARVAARRGACMAAAGTKPITTTGATARSCRALHVSTQIDPWHLASCAAAAGIWCGQGAGAAARRQHACCDEHDVGAASPAISPNEGHTSAAIRHIVNILAVRTAARDLDTPILPLSSLWVRGDRVKRRVQKMICS